MEAETHTVKVDDGGPAFTRHGPISDAEICTALIGACSPYSNYIADELNRRRRKERSVGHPLPSSKVLRKLRSLERRGVLKSSSIPNGYYGYRWLITEIGQTFIGNLDSRQ